MIGSIITDKEAVSAHIFMLFFASCLGFLNLVILTDLATDSFDLLHAFYSDTHCPSVLPNISIFFLLNVTAVYPTLYVCIHFVALP